MTNKIIRGDVLRGLATLPDRSVHCVITSPPYWGLRDYGVPGQIGLESTPEEYLTRMVAVFREVKRVLRDDGTVWLNMGDCYAGSHSDKYAAINPESLSYNMGQTKGGIEKSVRAEIEGLKPKDLVGMPWRLAFALQADGWWLRSDIIWSKPNPMPESVTDRPTKSHEYLFLLAKEARYFYDADAVREPHKEPERGRGELDVPNHEKPHGVARFALDWGQRIYNPAGRNRRTVWEIPTQPFPGSHFATFPEALVEPCIKAGTSERGCCPVCGAPWEREVEKRSEITFNQWRNNQNKENWKGRGDCQNPNYPNKGGSSMHGYYREVFGSENPPPKKTLGWSPTCTHTAEPIPCTVLDPFAGSGTVAKVARDLNRSSIGIELNAGYVEIIKRRMRLFEQLGFGVTYEIIEV